MIGWTHMNYCYYCHRLSWPLPSPLPLGSNYQIFPRTFNPFPWLSQKPRTRAQGLRGEWSGELLLATCSPVLQPSVSQTLYGWWSQDPQGELSVPHSRADTQQPSDIPKLPITRNQLTDGILSFETNHEEWQDLQLTLLQKLLESFKVYPPPPPLFFPIKPMSYFLSVLDLMLLSSTKKMTL